MVAVELGRPAGLGEAPAAPASPEGDLESLELELRQALHEALEHEPIARDSIRLVLGAIAADAALRRAQVRRMEELIRTAVRAPARPTRTAALVTIALAIGFTIGALIGRAL